MTSQELQVQQTRELEQKQEGTVPVRSFIPNADIYETDEALIVLLEMPGVDESHIDISIEDDVLTVEGRIDFSKNQGLSPIYAEYPVGHYRRGYQHKISAKRSDGVLTITLPKVEEVKTRRISIG
jgi:HSP20 family protein